MTTASVYYTSDGQASFILIDGDRAEVSGHYASEDCDRHGDDWQLHAVDGACRTLGWRTMPGATVIRQHDGRGTIRIEPVSPRPDPPRRVPLDPQTTMRHGVVHVTQAPVVVHGAPRDLLVAVDGLTIVTDTAGTLDDLDPQSDRAARDRVDDALAEIGYLRNGPLVPAGDGTQSWTCTADPADGRTSDVPPAARRWSDHPTLVRMDDTTAADLADLAAKLGIPADVLASAWIRRAAADAIRQYNHDTTPGWVAPGNRITRFLPDGSAVIERAGD